MSFTFARAASARMALAVILTTMAGCSGDNCTKASDHFTECLGGDTSQTSTTALSTPRCEGEYLCVSACVNSSDCKTLRAVFNADPVTAKPFLACQASCSSAK
jgi:hypothetical protein